MNDVPHHEKSTWMPLHKAGCASGKTVRSDGSVSRHQEGQ